MGCGVQLECHGSARFSRNIAHRHDANARLASQKCTIDPAAARRGRGCKVRRFPATGTGGRRTPPSAATEAAAPPVALGHARAQSTRR